MRDLVKELIKNKTKVVIEVTRNLLVGWIVKVHEGYMVFKMVVDIPDRKDTYIYYIPIKEVVYVRELVLTEHKELPPVEEGKKDVTKKETEKVLAKKD